VARSTPAAVRDLAPLIAKYADEAERERRLARPVVDALIDAGVFRLLVPPALGGAGASPPQQLLSGQVPTIGAIARRERIAPRYVRDLLSLAFLSPRIVKTIVEGRLPPELIVIGLTRRIDIPLLWSARERGPVFAI
jgi:hypothetical protein